MQLDISGLQSIYKTTGARDHPWFWINGAEHFIPNMLEIAAMVNYEPKVFPLEHFENERAEELGKLFEKYGSDKFIHGYNYLYSTLIPTEGPVEVLEIGLGTKNPEIASTMYFYIKKGFESTPCGCLRAFREFAGDRISLYGADIDRDILVNGESQIQCQFVDQLKPETMKEDVLFPGKQFDLVVIDGLHHLTADVNSIIHVWKRLKPGGSIVIEDVTIPRNWWVVDSVLSRDHIKFSTYFVKSNNDTWLYVIKRNDL